MTKNKYKMIHLFSFLLTLFVGMSFLHGNVHAQPAENIVIPKDYQSNKKVKENRSTVIPLFDEQHVLQGVNDQVTAYYYIPPEGVKKDAHLSIDVSYSELLLKGSSLTVLINETPVQSVFLDEEKEQMTLNISLAKDNVLPGFHTVELAFYGIVMENICVDDENRANWLTVSATSAVHFEKKQLNEAAELAAFPYPFVLANEEQEEGVAIIIPNEADDETLMAAFQISSLLQNQQSNAETVRILYENEVKKITGHIIVVGEQSQWSGIIRDLLGKEKITLKENEISFSTHLLEGNGASKQMLAILADESTVLQEKVKYLIDDRYREQFVGTNQKVQHVTIQDEISEVGKLSLQSFQMPDITLSGNEQQSLHYFYQLPTYVDVQKEATLHLHMKASKTLLADDIDHRESELMIMINDVPHSVRIKDLQQLTDDGIYEVEVPVAGDVLRKQPYIAIQFIGNGLRRGNYCEKPDNAQWIFIKNTSYFSFAEKEKRDVTDFSQWPYPFIKSDDLTELFIVYDEIHSPKIVQSLQLLFNHFHQAGKTDGIQIASADTITEEELAGKPVILVGKTNVFASLWESEDVFVSLDEQGFPSIDENGFMKETATHVAWIQPSIWDDAQAMAVFAPMSEQVDTAVTEALINYMENNVVQATVITENKEGHIFTNEEEATSDMSDENERTNDAQSNDTEVDRSLIYLFAGIVFVSFIVLFIGLRLKRKKNGRKNSRDNG